MAGSAESVSARQGGEDELFEALYEPVRHDLYRYALFYLGNREDAEDAMQDAALDAYGGIGRLRSPAYFKGWFFRILSVKCRRILSGRIERRARFCELSDLPEGAEPSAAFASALEMRDALMRLRDDEREVILLAVVGGYDSVEIGRLLRRPAGTVRSRMSRALAKMRAQESGEATAE